MINWVYNPEDYGKIKPITPGDYRVRIEKAEETLSKAGNDMIKITLKVSGCNQKVFYYIVFMPENPEMTNRKLGQVFDSFAITPGDYNLQSWIGRVGAAEIINKENSNGDMQSEVKKFIARKNQDSLPAWQENPVKQASVNSEMVNPDDIGCPF